MSTRIVIPQRLRTPKALQQRIRCQHHVFDLLDAAILFTGNRSDVLHDAFGCFCFAGARFTGYDDALVVFVGLHVVVGAFGDGEYVRWYFEAVFAFVGLKDVVGVYSQIYLKSV